MPLWRLLLHDVAAGYHAGALWPTEATEQLWQAGCNDPPPASEE